MVEAKGPTLTYEAFHAALYGSSSGSSVKDLVWRIMRTLPCIRLLGEIETLSQLAQGWTQGEFKFNSEFWQLIAPKLLASSFQLRTSPWEDCEDLPKVEDVILFR
jgi:hypothetical protein